MPTYPSPTSSVGTTQYSTEAQLNEDLKEMAGDTDVYWVYAERTQALNETMRLWQAMTGAWPTSFTLGVNSGEFAYVVPKQIASVQRVLYNGSPLTLISLQELDLGYPGWETTSGTPQYWTPLGVELIAVYPVPTTGTLTLQGLQEDVAFANASAVAKLGQEEETRILGYALHYLSFKEGVPELESSKGGFKDFIEAAGLRNARFRASAPYLQFMGVARDQKELGMKVGENAPGVRK